MLNYSSCYSTQSFLIATTRGATQSEARARRTGIGLVGEAPEWEVSRGSVVGAQDRAVHGDARLGVPGSVGWVDRWVQMIDLQFIILGDE
jgi:hypothetical protein